MHEQYVNPFVLPIWSNNKIDECTHAGNSNFVFRLYDLKNLSTP
jgi:hypothetical protein